MASISSTRVAASLGKRCFSSLFNTSVRSDFENLFSITLCSSRSRFRHQIMPHHSFHSGNFKWRLKSGYNFGTLAFSQSLLMLLGFGKKEEEDPVIALFREARMAQYEKKFDKAEKLFHEALKVAAQNHGNSEMTPREFLFAKTNIFDSLADMALARGQFDKAENLYKETMKCCFETGVEKEDNSVIEISIKLASIYAMQKRDKEAKVGFEFCIKAQEHKVNDKNDTDKDTMALLGLALESYGRYLMYHKHLEQALPLFEKAVTVATTTLGDEHPQTLILHNDLATLNILRKNYEPAEKTLKNAIEIGERIESTEVAALYCNLGALYLRRSEFDAAKKACEKGLKLAKKYQDTAAAYRAQKCLAKLEEVAKRTKSK